MHPLRVGRYVKTSLLFLAGLFAGASLEAQSLNLQFDNSSTWSDSDVYFTFFDAHDATGGAASGTLPGFVATWGQGGTGASISTIYSGTYTYQSVVSESLTASTSTTATITSTSSQKSYWTDSITLADLKANGGVNVTTANSTRVYVTLGNALNLSTTLPLGPNGGALSFGTPSLSSMADPNWNVRWDVFEMTVTPTYGDQGDVTAINSTAIPLKLQSFTSASSTTAAQTAQTSSNYGNYVDAANAYVTANAGNNTITSSVSGSTVTVPGYVTNNGTFLRVEGINNGQQATSVTSPGTTAGALQYSSSPTGVAQIGANATFGDYVKYLYNTGTSTPLADSQVTSVGGTNYGFGASVSAVTWNSGQTVSASWLANGGSYYSSGTLTPITTGGTGAAVQLSGSFTANGASIGTFKVILPPDNVGAAVSSTSNFLQSAVTYAADPGANFGLIFEYTPVGGVTSTYLDYNEFVNAVNQQNTSGSSNVAGQAGALMRQVFHDYGAGMAFGLIGSAAIDPITGTAFGVEGSQVWTDIWEKLAGGGTIVYNGATYDKSNAPSMPLFGELWGGTSATSGSLANYNQWAALAYESSTTVYGSPYSDYLQSVGFNLLSENGTSYDVDHVTVTVLGTEAVPEASVCLLVVLAGLALFIVHRKFPRTEKQ